MNSAPAYGIRSLVHSYGEKTVLDIPDLDIPEGQACAFLGPNGSGKTTLLSILACLLTPVSGSVRMFGIEMTRNKYSKLRKNATMVHQKPALFSTTVRDNIAFGLRAAGCSSKEIKHRVHQIIEELKLEDVAEKHARKLSGGEAQRVVLARALVLGLPIILLDEPTNSLDDASRPVLLELLKRTIQTHKTTVLIATHDLNFLDPLDARIIRLNEGKIEQDRGVRS
jgi:tungstate transport system ATP-binding protein